MQKIRRITGLFVLSLMAAFFLAACGGGGGDNPPPPPTATTVAATGITLHTATINGSVNPQAQATTALFEWGTDSALSAPTSTSPQAIGAGSADNSVSASLTGLTLGTTYFYRVVATNASGTQKGAIASFTTALPNSPPSATTNSATSVTSSGAVLNGTVIPNELATTAVFEWGTDSNLATFASTASQALGAGTTSVAITASLTGLTPGTAYFFRVAATNSAGTTKGSIASFTAVAQAPTVSTAAATSITITGATLNGTVNPNGLAVSDSHFEWGTDSNLATFTSTSVQALAAGFTGQALTASLTGLTPGTTYFFRVAATNSVGPSKGSIVSFVTTAQAPTVATAAADNISATGATLHGTVNPNGLAVTDAHFEYGTDSNLATFTSTSAQPLTAGLTNQALAASPTGLTPGTTYFFRVAATNSVGTSKGSILSFATSANPLPTANAGPDQIVFQGKTVTLNGSGSADGFGGTLTYQWTAPAGVTLSSTTSVSPTFTAPQVDYPSAVLTFGLTVTSSRGPVSLPDNVNVTVKWGFFDDFSTDTTGTYSPTQTLGSGSTFTWTPDVGEGAASVITGLNMALKFQRDFGIAGPSLSDTGVFSLVFFPTDVHGAGNGIIIRIGEVDAGAYYEINTIDSTIKKVFGGSPTETRPFTFTFDPFTGYTLKLRFSQSVTTFEVDGVTLATLNVLDTSINAFDFSVETKNMNAFYDEIKLEAAP